MTEQKVITLLNAEQQAAFEDAAAAIQADADDTDLDVKTYGGDVTAGDIVRVACEAYTGSVDFGGGEA